MDTRRFRMLVTWNVVLTVVLLASLGANAALVNAAADPPVKVFTAQIEHDGLDWGNGAFKNISSTDYSPVAAVPINLGTDHFHHCIAVGSMGTDWNGQGRYTIGVGYDTSANIEPYSKREFEFIDQVNINHEDFQEVSTVVGRQFSGGSHTAYLLAKKNNPGSSYLVVERAVLAVICMKVQF